MSRLKKLPIGIQTFSKIIDGNFLYVDKSKHALKLIENYQYLFLSRPRRFGKSLFMDTLHNIFEGNKEYFKGLYIYDKWDWKDKYPVIKISFSGGIRCEDTLYSGLLRIIESNKERLGVECRCSKDINVCFEELIEKTYQKYKKQVVILIDEYDKPILDNLEYMKAAKIIRDGIRDFYTRIKDNDRYIKFAMLTGVTKFSKVSIFSGLNNLEDISLNKEYGDICGYTRENLLTIFKPYLQDVSMEKIRYWYDGYNFLGEKVYNPYDILLFIKNDKMFKNYWFETGTPTFLINLIKQNNYFLPELENIEIEENIANSFDIENISLETIMFQSGYLTIKEIITTKRNKIRYILDFPNFEVQTSFYDYILSVFASVSKRSRIADDLYDIFEDGDIKELESVIKRLFASIAYNNFTNNYIENYEGFYASVLYAYFASLGVEIIAEDVTNQGRIDLTVKVENKVFLFEFKVVNLKDINEDPLKQIKEKKYYEKYSGEVYIIGIVFDRKDRNVSMFEWERV